MFNQDKDKKQKNEMRVWKKVVRVCRRLEFLSVGETVFEVRRGEEAEAEAGWWVRRIKKG